MASHSHVHSGHASSLFPPDIHTSPHASLRATHLPPITHTLSAGVNGPPPESTLLTTPVRKAQRLLPLVSRIAMGLLTVLLERAARKSRRCPRLPVSHALVSYCSSLMPFFSLSIPPLRCVSTHAHLPQSLTSMCIIVGSVGGPSSVASFRSEQQQEGERSFSLAFSNGHSTSIQAHLRRERGN